MGWAARQAVELKSPISATIRLSEVNFCASAAASLGSARLSPTIITMGRPCTRPDALIHSTPRSIAFWKSWPYSAKLPGRGALSPMWIGSPLHTRGTPGGEHARGEQQDLREQSEHELHPFGPADGSHSRGACHGPQCVPEHLPKPIRCQVALSPVTDPYPRESGPLGVLQTRLTVP